MDDDESRVGATSDGAAGRREYGGDDPYRAAGGESSDAHDGIGLRILDDGRDTDDGDGFADGDPDGQDGQEGQDGDSGDEGAPPPGHRKKRRRRRVRTVLITTVVMMLSLVLLAAVGVWWFIDHYAGKVDRIENAFPNIPAAEQPPRGKGLNFLLVGLDSRNDMPTTGRNAKGPLWQEGMQRSDATMLLHLSADRRSAYIVSVPRDTWVAIPGRGEAKVNAAFSWGGPPLLIDTVQRLTDIRVDHFAAIDWEGFKRLTDALGGVDVEVSEDVPAGEDNRAWTAGRHHMDGAEALSYVRERKGLPRGDLDRVERQQNFMRAVFEELLSGGKLSDPLGLPGLLDAITDAISVDDRMSNSDLRDLVWGMRKLRGDDVRFMTAPISELKTINGQDAAVLAPEKSKFMWDNMRADTMDIYLRRYPHEETPDYVR
ncbi:LCP family protein [Yinghuangia soli]|uniref:LCP family protein n=1 Tax=Yinghuangia soli TaxID=2908204 RepID=A0AA41TXI4_9ACTN|nr:LCP family protein [Yinghuangia soli]MCF2526873.1 LCP family protein [Yinghuangia soli]